MSWSFTRATTRRHVEPAVPLCKPVRQRGGPLSVYARLSAIVARGDYRSLCLLTQVMCTEPMENDCPLSNMTLLCGSRPTVTFVSCSGAHQPCENVRCGRHWSKPLLMEKSTKRLLENPLQILKVVGLHNRLKSRCRGSGFQLMEGPDWDGHEGHAAIVRTCGSTWWSRVIVATSMSTWRLGRRN
jgi:hypothetical protein